MMLDFNENSYYISNIIWEGFLIYANINGAVGSGVGLNPSQVIQNEPPLYL